MLFEWFCGFKSFVWGFCGDGLERKVKEFGKKLRSYENLNLGRGDSIRGRF